MRNEEREKIREKRKKGRGELGWLFFLQLCPVVAVGRVGSPKGSPHFS
jgi:hypothetical protein